jgi:energy-coupling factor transporter ATP-binding protein EcfA2
MADLPHLAASIVTQIAPLEDYVSAPAQELAFTENPYSHSNADELLLGRVQEKSLPFGSTRVVFLHGNAGAGKTSLLRHIARLQAERYLEGQSTTLLLYLDAQGKGLSQLEDVMARALQDLRAHFTYHSLASLTRMNCVVPIVDGFDELIGPSSAREAFTNLAQFLSQLDCKGALITSSRSAFIDYRTLHERATEIALAQGLSYEIFPVELRAWDDDFVFRLAKMKLGASDVKLSQIKSLIESPAGELIRKPFFLSHICSIIAEGGSVQGDRDLVSQVVNASLKRETGKLQDKRQKPVLTTEQHSGFCQAIADEMWLQERSDLDVSTIKTIAELFAEDAGLSPEDNKLLQDRSIAHGLLKKTQGDTDRREFEHELFRFEFQATRFATALLGNDVDIKDYILRRELAPDLTDRVVAIRNFSEEELTLIINKLSDIALRSRNNPYAATNGAIVVSTFLRSQKNPPKGGRFTGLHFRNEKLANIYFSGWSIRDCTFERVDITGTTFNDCLINNDLFITCRVSSTTLFKGCEIDTHMFAGIEDEKGKEYYDPSEIANMLLTLGAEMPKGLEIERLERTPLITKRLDLAERFLLHAKTHFNMSEDDDWVQSRLKYEKGDWTEIERAFRKHGLLQDVRTQKSGPATPIWRLTVPPDAILRARATQDKSKPQLSEFWADIGRV